MAGLLDALMQGQGASAAGAGGQGVQGQGLLQLLQAQANPEQTMANFTEQGLGGASMTPEFQAKLSDISRLGGYGGGGYLNNYQGTNQTQQGGQGSGGQPMLGEAGLLGQLRQVEGLTPQESLQFYANGSFTADDGTKYASEHPYMRFRRAQQGKFTTQGGGGIGAHQGGFAGGYGRSGQGPGGGTGSF